ncbi:hypothetical protein GQ607_013932 [Colletotrichum asianum]|uniref:Uncharacterized protein n=1 Tax=Colletotrichum asianum TaxID=702518 RepID=A0A8H3W3I9_9PEZI|nr:hypothetical protein GQ607_013932 [Colletotrichum asianum]
MYSNYSSRTLTKNNKLRETSYNFNKLSLLKTILLTLDNLASNLTSLKKLKSLYSTKDLKIKLKIKSLRLINLITSSSMLNSL